MGFRSRARTVYDIHIQRRTIVSSGFHPLDILSRTLESSLVDPPTEDFCISSGSWLTCSPCPRGVLQEVDSGDGV